MSSNEIKNSYATSIGVTRTKKSVVMALVSIAATFGFLASPLSPAPALSTVRMPALAAIRMEQSEWEKYAAKRGQGDLEATENEYRKVSSTALLLLPGAGTGPINSE